MKKINKSVVCLCLILLSSSCLTSDYINKTSYNGVIQEIYQDKKNHFVFSFSVKTKTEINKVVVAEFFPYSWKYAEVGDSIIKEQGDLYIRIKKKNGESKNFYFNP